MVPIFLKHNYEVMKDLHVLEGHIYEEVHICGVVEADVHNLMKQLQLQLSNSMPKSEEIRKNYSLQYKKHLYLESFLNSQSRCYTFMQIYE